MPGVLDDDALEALLDRLHARSTDQDPALVSYFTPLFTAGEPFALDEGDPKRFLADKLVALERDKATFCYQMCRALRAVRAVEAGTSHGVSTLNLAAAVRANCRATGEAGIVYGDYFDFIADPKNRLSTMTLPFAGGLEVTVRV